METEHCPHLYWPGEANYGKVKSPLHPLSPCSDCEGKKKAAASTIGSPLPIVTRPVPAILETESWFVTR